MNIEKDSIKTSKSRLHVIPDDVKPLDVVETKILAGPDKQVKPKDMRVLTNDIFCHQKCPYQNRNVKYTAKAAEMKTFTARIFGLTICKCNKYNRIIKEIPYDGKNYIYPPRLYRCAVCIEENGYY